MTNDNSNVKTIDLTPTNASVFGMVRRIYSTDAKHAREIFFAAYPTLSEKYFTACITGNYIAKVSGAVEVNLDN